MIIHVLVLVSIAAGDVRTCRWSMATGKTETETENDAQKRRAAGDLH